MTGARGVYTADMTDDELVAEAIRVDEADGLHVEAAMIRALTPESRVQFAASLRGLS